MYDDDESMTRFDAALGCPCGPLSLTSTPLLIAEPGQETRHSAVISHAERNVRNE